MDKVLNLYKKELNDLFNEIQRFAKKHPDLALEYSNLSENPHISMLIQAFSLVHTKLNLALEENSSEFITNLLEILYPHYNTPIPSLAIIELEADKNQKLPVNIPKGKLLEMRSNNSTCTFQLCYDLQVLPLQIKHAICSSLVEKKSDNLEANTKTVLTIQLQTLGETKISSLGFRKIRFFIKGFNRLEYSILQNLMNNVTAVTINQPGNDVSAITLNKNSIKPVGFSEQDAILPCYSGSLSSYRLITEFFVFPQKFLFFDLNLDQLAFSAHSTDLEINFYLNNSQLEGLISKENFLLNTTPIINLFPLESDPITVTKDKVEYPITMDNKNPELYKVYKIENVKLAANGKEQEGHYLFSYDLHKNNKDVFWYFIKKLNLLDVDSDKQLYISLINQDRFLNENFQYLYLQATCFNGNLPNDCYLEKTANFRFVDNTIAVSNIKCIIKPTLVYTLNTNNEQKGKLLAHLSLHYFNIINESNAKDLFKEILAIYNFNNLKLNKLMIESINKVTIQEEVAKIRIGKSYIFCRGNLIEIHFDVSKLTESIIYLFLKVLDDFLAMYCSVNSFTKLCGLTNDGTILYQGPPRNGIKCLI